MAGALADELAGLGWARELVEEALAGADAAAMERRLLDAAPAALRGSPGEFARAAELIRAVAQALGRHPRGTAT
jgi:hypothetical protein